MPELPEVETIKRSLEKKIIGLEIKRIEILAPKSFIGDPKMLQGKKVLKITRRAKILQADLVGDLSLLIHLKMSGQLIYDDGKRRFIGGHPTPDMTSQMPNKHTRVIINFSDGSRLYFNDQRMFGWIKVVADKKVRVEVEQMLSKLGPEPLEKGFSWQVLKLNLLKHPKTPIKTAILDQSVVAGVGNIYASEACFLAGIDPRTKVSVLSDEQFKTLYKGIVGSLKKGIKYGGSTKTHFVDADGKKGYFLDYAYVYGLDKKPCKNCGTVIEKLQLNSRGTYFCINCQK